MEISAARTVTEEPAGEYRIRLDSSKFLVRKKPYPNARPCLSILDLSQYEGEAFERIARTILKACLHSPGALVRDSVLVQRNHRGEPYGETDAVEFLVAAGFSVEMARRIAPEGWVFQFSTRYVKYCHETATKLSDNLTEEELGNFGPRNNEEAFQGCGYLS